MLFFQQHKLRIITIVYWFLLAYIVAALFWWFIALNKQNEQTSHLKMEQLQKNNPLYFAETEKIISEQKRKEAQYLGEGFTFLVVILIGAVFVYRAVHRQIKLSEQQQNFMMAVTHELKTPIAVAKLNLETLLKHKLDEQQQQKLMFNTLEETDRLNNLCNNILLASQLDSFNYNTNKQEINFSNLIVTAVTSFQNRYTKRKISSLIEENIFIVGETILIQMLVNNLIENALKYSPKESEIKVELNSSNQQVKFLVIDNGVGIDDKDKKKIFDKFYRAGNENTRKTKGTGLGLYLCSKICEKHHAFIAVNNNLPQGSIFTVTFNM